MYANPYNGYVQQQPMYQNNYRGGGRGGSRGGGRSNQSDEWWDK